ncbi:SRPBCC family protein [halophilic archaeon]|nr:SRPBCC family protein [halophilic archaeon]
MRTVEVSRFVNATPAEIERELLPERVVRFEGTFSVNEVEEGEDETAVLARGGGLQTVLVFEEREAGIAYRQRGDEGPFESMETTLTLDRENEGTRVIARSSVSLGLPVASVSDRVAAWKRRGELRRLLDALAADVE